MKEKITLALAQISSQRENKKENLRKIEELTMRAKEQRADLVIFPELCLTGYVVRDQLYELAEVLDRTDAADGSTIARVRVPEASLSRFRHSFPEARKAS